MKSVEAVETGRTEECVAGRSRNPEAIFARANWIWPDSYHWDIHNSYALFRKELVLPEVPEEAPLFITADQSYQLYVNGRYVCRGPARGFQHHWPYDEVDVREFLRSGRNVLAVRAHNPGFSNFQYVTQGFAGLLVAAHWGDTEVLSDDSWKARRQKGVTPGTVPTSLQLFCQEHIDLRCEDPHWMETNFQDTDWEAPVAQHPWNGMPWYSLEPRGIPQLEERFAPAPTLVGCAFGPCAEDYVTTRDVARTRFSEGLVHEPFHASGESIVAAVSGPGAFVSYLLDFGRTVVGSVGFEISGAAGGEIIDTLHVETIEPSTLTPDYLPDQGSRMAFGNRLICREGAQSHMFYHAFGFRYMVLTVRDSLGELQIRPMLRSTLYPMERKGSFQSADPLLEKIWETCAWTQRVCSLDAYVDTPWREQVQWWGDARVQAKNTFFYSGDTRLFRRGIAQIASETVPNGLTYGHAPTMAHKCILPDFTLVWLITIWDYYWQTGSLEPFLTHQEKIRRALSYFEANTDPEIGLVAYDKRYWLFLDWTDLHKEGYSTVYNLWLLIALEKLGALHRRGGDLAEAERLADWAGRLRVALSRLVREDGLLCDGFTFEGTRVAHASVHSQTLAILAGFQSERNSVRIEQSLLPLVRDGARPAVYPSCYWITYLFEVLTSAGYGDAVVNYIRTHWAGMAEHGTTWEVFEPQRAHESFSHAWSAHPLYHLMQTVGGIRQSAPGWRQITFQPVFEGDRGEVSVPTPLGSVQSCWKRVDSRIAVRLSLPLGMSARVLLPGLPPSILTGEACWDLEEISEQPGLDIPFMDVPWLLPADAELVSGAAPTK